MIRFRRHVLVAFLLKRAVSFALYIIRQCATYSVYTRGQFCFLALHIGIFIFNSKFLDAVSVWGLTGTKDQSVSFLGLEFK